MDEYEKAHPDEWCPISDRVLKEMYPTECSSQEGRDARAETMTDEEFEIIFDVVMHRYRRMRKKKQASQEGQQSQQSDQQTEGQEQEIMVEQ
jgi:hypothetical protein